MSKWPYSASIDPRSSTVARLNLHSGALGDPFIKSMAGAALISFLKSRGAFAAVAGALLAFKATLSANSLTFKVMSATFAPSMRSKILPPENNCHQLLKYP